MSAFSGIVAKQRRLNRQVAVGPAIRATMNEEIVYRKPGKRMYSVASLQEFHDFFLIRGMLSICLRKVLKARHFPGWNSINPSA